MNIKKLRGNITLKLVAAVTVLAFSFFPGLSFAQDPKNEDPNLDQVPRSLREHPHVTDNLPLSSVITIDNWDNFNLGTDMGENNIAASLQYPAWHYVAYNFNNGHHTENGTDWAAVTPDFGDLMAGDPVVAYDGIGNLFYINLFPRNSIEGVKVVRSSDNGATWSSPVIGAYGSDKCWIACDQTNGPYANYVYVCLTNSGIGAFARSTNHGESFTTTFAPPDQSVPGMSVCVGPYGNIQGGAVYCVTNSGTPFNSVYTFYRSLDGGLSFTLMSAQQFANTVGTEVNGRNSVEGMRTRPYPYIVADNSYGQHRGRLYNVYASNDPPGSGNKPDIWLRYSDDGGATFSDSIRVNDDANTQANHQYHPAVWCDKETGRLYLNWMDTRDTPTSDSAYIYATYSDDGGLTFAPNQKISNKKMKIDCPTCPGDGTPRYQGDYNGIVSNRKSSLSGWTDFRNGSFMSVAGYFPDFALAIDHDSDSLFAKNDSVDFVVSVPAVKLYTDTVRLSCEVAPLPAGGTVTFSFPQGDIITGFPGSKLVRMKSSGPVPSGEYQVIITAAGPNGTPVHRRTATVRVIHIIEVTATPPAICLGASTQLLAVPLSGTPPFTYSWTSNPAGFTSGIANPVAEPVTNTWYIVSVTDNAGVTETDSVLVTISPVPGMPGPIYGPDVVCTGSTATFSVAEVFGATSYSWTVPPDVVINQGQNTPLIDVLWGDTPGTVSVIAGNLCGNSNPSVRDISTTGEPPMPGAISGPSLACVNAEISYSIDTVPGAESYLWTMFPDAFITGGQGTTTVMVTWGKHPGTVNVLAQNECGSGPLSSKNVDLDTLPANAGQITGKDTVCKDHSGYIYSVGEISGAVSYEWVVPEGVSINGPATEREISVDFSSVAVSGEISVKGMNTCGYGGESKRPIVVNPCAGLDANSYERFVQIFPNPAKDLLNIRIGRAAKQFRILMTDINGRIVSDSELSNIQPAFTVKADISFLAAGMYFIRIFSDDDLFSGRIVIE